MTHVSVANVAITEVTFPPAQKSNPSAYSLSARTLLSPKAARRLEETQVDHAGKYAPEHDGYLHQALVQGDVEARYEGIMLGLSCRETLAIFC